MSLAIESNRINITDNLGNITFDTNNKMMYIHANVALSIMIPTRTGKTTGVQQADILVGTIPYPAEFFIGSQLKNGYYREINGSFYRGSAWVNDVWAGSRFLTLYINGSNIYLRDMWYSNHKDVSFTGENISFYIYAGNYDL